MCCTKIYTEYLIMMDSKNSKSSAIIRIGLIVTGVAGTFQLINALTRHDNRYGSISKGEEIMMYGLEITCLSIMWKLFEDNGII